MMLTTCTCILAVDFTCFPRRFVKAEVFGTGLVRPTLTTPFLLPPSHVHSVGSVHVCIYDQGRTVPARCLKGGGACGRAEFYGSKDSTVRLGTPSTTTRT